MTMDRDPMTTLRDWLDDRAATAGSSEASFRETMRLVRHTPQGRRARILQAMRGHTGRESSRPAFQVGAVAIVVASAGLALAMALGWSASGDREPHGEPASPSPIPTEATAEPALPSIDRSLHTAETLDDGSVLLIGGAADSAPSLQRFDPTTGRLSDTGELTMPRSEHASVLLGDGRVLIVGGYGTDGSRPVAEWFDPATGTSTADAGIDLAMTRPTASLLDDGRILLAGGANSANAIVGSALIWDPETSTTELVESMTATRMGHTSTTMPSGRVLVVGGETCCGDSPLASAEIWHPGRATFIATGDMSQGRMDHSATLLADGSVLVIGGTTPTLTCVFRLGPLEWCERYPRFASVGEVWDPGTGTFSVVPDLHISRAQHSATALADGRILLVGGHSSESDEDGGIVASPMLLDPRDYGLAPAIVRPEAPDAR